MRGSNLFDRTADALQTRALDANVRLVLFDITVLEPRTTQLEPNATNSTTSI